MSNIITNITKSPDKMTFNMQNVPISFANAVRRMCIAEVPIVCIDRESIVFIKNTSILHNGFLTNRLKLIPIKNTDDIYKNYDDYEIKIDIKNDSMEIKNVYANDFQIFKNDEKINSDDILVFPTLLIAKLKPKNHIILSAKFKIDIGKNGAEFNPTTNCLYIFERDEKLIKKMIKEIKDPDMLEEFKICDSDRIYKKTKDGEPAIFNFTIETTGSLPCSKIVQYSLIELKKKLENVVTHIKSPDESDYISVMKSKTLEGATDIVLFNEDDTLGNLITYQLFKNPNVDYAGYLIPHPLDRKVIIRIKTKTGEATTHALNDINNLIKFIDKIKKKFN